VEVPITAAAASHEAINAGENNGRKITRNQKRKHDEINHIQKTYAMAKKIDNLPPEVGQQLLGFVPPKDLISLSISSTSMKTLASNPKLWSNMKVNKEKLQKHGLEILFAINRYKKIKNIDLSEMTFTRRELRSNLNAIASSFVEDLDLSHICLTEVPPKLLSQVAGAGHLQKVNFGMTSLTIKQCINVLESCITSPTLKDIGLKDADLYNKWDPIKKVLNNVPSELLGRAVGNLEKVDLSGTLLNTEQCIAVFKSCITSLTLKDVALELVCLNDVPSEVLGQGVGNLEKVNLGYTSLSTLQIKAVLKSCITSPTLKDVTLEEAELDNVPTGLLAQAVGNLEKVDLSHTHLATEKLIAVLKSCITSPTLQYVNLICSELYNVPTELLEEAVDNLIQCRVTGGSFSYNFGSQEQALILGKEEHLLVNKIEISKK